MSLLMGLPFGNRDSDDAAGGEVTPGSGQVDFP